MLFTDRITIQKTNRVYTDEGFLVVDARIARSGIQEYYAFELGLSDRESTDVVKVFRPESEVFNADSLASFANKTITDNHPDEMVTADNAKKLSVGHSGNEVTKDGMFANTTLFFTDKEIIKKVENGKVEISNGYTSDLDFTPGVTDDGEAYDIIQTGIKGNHIAVVDKGRCGPSCRIADHKPKKEDIPTMGKLTLDGVDFEASDQVIQAVGIVVKRLKDAEEKLETEDGDEEEKKKKEDEEKEEMKKDHKKELDTVQAKLDDSLSKNPTPQMLDQLVENRMATLDAARRIMPELKFEGKDCETIRKEVVAAKCSNLDEKASVDYIRARFDSLTETPANSQSDLNNSFKDHLNKDKKDEPLTGRDKFVNNTRDAWKGGKK